MHASLFNVQNRKERPLHVGLVGLGISTLAVYGFLMRPDTVFTVRDQRRALPDGLLPDGIHRTLIGDGYLDHIDEDVLVLSPSVRPDLPMLLAARARGVTVTTECEIFYTLFDGDLYAVTGSDGKSTTASIAHRLLFEGGCYTDPLLGGNIGTPLLSHLQRNAAPDAIVAELSSFQLLHRTPHAKRALITNLTPNHLDVHSSLEEYYHTKLRLLSMAEEPVLNADDPTLFTHALRHNLYAVYGSEGIPLPRAEHTFIFTKEGIVRDGVLLLGAKMLSPFPPLFAKNLLAAIALCDGKISCETLSDTVSRLVPLPHRTETVRTVSGVCYVDSSADTTPSRSAATLSQLGANVILLAGGRGKGVTYDPILSSLPKVRHAVLYGENREEIFEALHTNGCPCTLTDTLSHAVSIASMLAMSGDTVLLSPMSTSHDQYASFHERGRDFQAAVWTL